MIGHFCTIWLVPLEKPTRSSWKFYRQPIFGQRIPVKFWKLSGVSDPNFRSGPDSSRQRSVLSCLQCSCFIS